MDKVRVKRADSREPATIVDPRIVKIVDSREPAMIKDKLLEQGWQVRLLHSGDYSFMTYDYKRVGVTRKTISDLLSSIGHKPNPEQPGRKEKSFSQQLEEMDDYFDIKRILLEGNWQRVVSDDRIISPRGIEYYTWDMVWNYLDTWQDREHKLTISLNEGHTIRTLNRLYARYQKPYHTGGLNTRNLVGDDRVLAFPSGCRGKTGLKLLEEIGSLQNIANADFNKLLAVDGVGEKRAESLVLHFRRGSNEHRV